LPPLGLFQFRRLMPARAREFFLFEVDGFAPPPFAKFVDFRPKQKSLPVRSKSILFPQPKKEPFFFLWLGLCFPFGVFSLTGRHFSLPHSSGNLSSRTGLQETSVKRPFFLKRMDEGVSPRFTKPSLPPSGFTVSRIFPERRTALFSLLRNSSELPFSPNRFQLPKPLFSPPPWNHARENVFLTRAGRLAPVSFSLRTGPPPPLRTAFR